MAVVDDDLPVAGDEIGNGLPANEALDYGDIDPPGRSALRALDLSDRLRIEAEELRELRDPLVQKRAPVNQDQRAARARCDEVRPDHGLADAGRRDEDTRIVREKRSRRRLLNRRQRAVESNVQSGSGDALVRDLEHDPVSSEQLLEIRKASTRERDMQGEFLGARDHPRYRRGRQSHALLLIELRILERREPLDLVQKGRREALLRDEQPLREHGRDSRGADP